MGISEIKKLPLREKLQIMEAIWIDLRGHVEDSGVPREHRDLLDSRRERVSTGEVKMRDWDAVKKSIGRP
jgi:hypothetical protein